ncbi:MAG: prepilin-type N-terminal cleavage/methylation domain-containing protein [Cyanobacteria bacterium J06650_10]
MVYKKEYISHSSSGFTMIELLVVVTMIGLIAAISAPSWMGFLTRQRLNAARTDLLGVLRTAQQDAQALQRSKTVEFSSTDLSVTVKSGDSATGVTTVLGESALGKKFSLTTAPSTSSSIVFDYDGAVRTEDLIAIKIEDDNSSAQSCVIVTTLLGGLKPANDDLCDNFFSL